MSHITVNMLHFLVVDTYGFPLHFVVTIPYMFAVIMGCTMHILFQDNSVTLKLISTSVLATSRAACFAYVLAITVFVSLPYSRPPHCHGCILATLFQARYGAP